MSTPSKLAGSNPLGRIDMPRIPAHWLASVVYLYPTVDAAQSGTGTGEGGTGCVVSVPWKELFREKTVFHQYFATNDHVRVNARAMRINTLDGSSVVMEIDPEMWIPHPENDDLAILQATQLPENLDLVGIPREMFLTEELKLKNDIGPGDDVFLIGRYVDIEGKTYNTPTVRTGIVSLFPRDPIPQPQRAHLQETVVVEARSRSGYSGSPTFVVQSPRISHEKVPATVDYLVQSPCFFLGITYAHYAGGGTPGNPSDSGMMLVVPANRLERLLDLPELQRKRLQDERYWLERPDQLAASLGLDG